MKKKNLLIVQITFCIMAFAAGCYQSHPNRISGTIMSLNTTTHEIIIKEVYTREEKKIVADAQSISDLKPGTQVRVQLRPGTSEAELISIHTPKKKEKANEDDS